MAVFDILWLSIAISLAAVAYLRLSHNKHTFASATGVVPAKSSTQHAYTPSEATPSEKPALRSLASFSDDIASTFPPSQRKMIESLYHKLSEQQRKQMASVSLDAAVFQKSILKFDEDYTDADPSEFVYSGFSVREIQAFGDFPDYSVLSEVPLPKPYLEFDIDKALPRPYRPFRWSYHQTMSLTKLEPDWWIELENTYKTRIAQRRALYAEHGDAVLQWLPGSKLACKELMEMVLQFLCARYPQYFSLSHDKLHLENKILGTTVNLRDRHPLLILLDNVPEDFAIMLRHPITGHYHFRAGVICSALGWNVGTKIDLPLHEIHSPIPDYKEKMQFSMDRFFAKMPASKPIQRGSWGLEVDEPLYMPPGHPHELYRERQEPSLTRERIHLRVDWQTLRRLPLSGAIVFNFKALFTSLEDFRHEPYIPSLILKNLNEGKENLMKYKNTWHVEHIAKPALVEYEKEQLSSGVMEKDWTVQTLDQSPFFPEWETLWHRQQGF